MMALKPARLDGGESDGSGKPGDAMRPHALRDVEHPGELLLLRGLGRLAAARQQVPAGLLSGHEQGRVRVSSPIGSRGSGFRHRQPVSGRGSWAPRASACSGSRRATRRTCPSRVGPRCSWSDRWSGAVRSESPWPRRMRAQKARDKPAERGGKQSRARRAAAARADGLGRQRRLCMRSANGFTLSMIARPDNSRRSRR